MSSIYLSVDRACWTERKLREGKLGGAENRFRRLRGLLIHEGYDVYDPVLNEYGGKTDLVIHSNGFDSTRTATAHCLWAGSWHAAVHDSRADEVIMISEFMKQKMGCDRAIVIPAPYEKDIDNYKGFSYVKNRIVCTSNPNRWYSHGVELVKILASKGLSCELQFAGGNRLYGDGFNECQNFKSEQYGDVHLVYRGILKRHHLMGLLSGAHVWVYPNFHDNSETFCVSMIEAAALNIPVILPRREPFVSVLPEAFFVDTVEEMADKVEDIFLHGPDRMNYDVSRYSEDVVNAQLLKVIEGLL